jgi:hypothetical protein
VSLDEHGRHKIVHARKDGGFGDWEALVNLGSAINTEAAEAGASFSPDGKCQFFSRAGDIFRVSARTLEASAAKGAPDKAPTTDSRNIKE